MNGIDIIHGEGIPCLIWDFSKDNQEPTNRSISHELTVLVIIRCAHYAARKQIVFGNDLLDELSKNAYCFMMYGFIQCGFPSYADDLLLLSLLKRGMNYLMDICFANSISERCLYHIGKHGSRI